MKRAWPWPCAPERKAERRREQMRRAAKAYRERHPDRHKAAEKRWRTANRDRKLQMLVDWRKANPDRVRAQIEKMRRRRAQRLRSDPEYALRQTEYKRAWRLRYEGVAAPRATRDLPAWLTGAVPKGRGDSRVHLVGGERPEST